MRFAKIDKCDISAGTGCRVVLWIQGCSIHCKGCHNPELWDFSGGKEFTDAEIEEISTLMNRPFISGLSILGGEPLSPCNQKDLAAFVKLVKFRFPEKDIWIYSGYDLEDLLPGGGANTTSTSDILSHVDVAVLGPFIQEERDISTNNLWRGSRNQRVLDMPATLATNSKVYVKGIPNND